MKRFLVIATLPIISALLFSRFNVRGPVFHSWGEVLELTAFLPLSMANLAWVLLAYTLYRWFRMPSLATGASMVAAVLLASPIGRTILYYSPLVYPIF